MTDPPANEKIIRVPWQPLVSNQTTVPEPLAVALAGVVIEWSRFELMLVSHTSTMMAVPNIRQLADKAPKSFKGKIDLWKRCISCLYPKIDLYQKHAAEICSKGKIIALHRNRLIHSLWEMEDFEETGQLRILSYEGLEFVEKHENLSIDTEYVATLHQDILTLTSALATLKFNIAWHAKEGYLPLGTDQTSSD